MRGLLSAGFAHLDEKLQLVPRLLAVAVSPFAYDDDDTTFCLNSMDVRTDWDDCTFDLEEYVAEHCLDRGKAKYRLAAYVAYVADKDVATTWSFNSGLFVAYFLEDRRWYKADDSTVHCMDMNGTPPSAFPYLCIFERVDLPPQLLWPPMQEAPI